MGRPMGYLDDARSWARRQGSPVTIGLILSLIASYLLMWFTEGRPFSSLIFDPAHPLPWTPLTYPFAGEGPVIFFLFMLLWLYWIGSSLEHDLGSRKFGVLCLVMTLLPVLFLGFGSLLVQRPTSLANELLPLAALTVAWGTRNSSLPVRLWGIIPVTGAMIAILDVLIVIFSYPPIVSWLAVLPLGFAYLFAKNKVPFFTYSKPVYAYKPSKQKVQEEARYFEEVKKREQERAERERLRKLFEKSGLD